MTKCAIYGRVSTADQHVETQLYQLRAAVVCNLTIRFRGTLGLAGMPAKGLCGTTQMQRSQDEPPPPV